MQLITAPINIGQAGPEVANLQDVLFVLLERNIIEAAIEPNRPTEEELQKLTELLKRERDPRQSYPATHQVLPDPTGTWRQPARFRR